MRITVYLLLLAPAALAILGPRLARHLAPAAAVRTLTALAIAAASATTWGLTALAIGGLGRTAEIQAYARTSPAALAATDPVPRTLGALALALLAAAVARFIHTAWRCRRETRALTSAHAGLPAAGDLIVIDTDHIDAFALPGRWGGSW